MALFTLMTDSCCDELKSNLIKNEILYIPVSFMKDEEVFYDNFDSNEEYKAFYDDLLQGQTYKTAGINPYDIESFFNEHIEEGKDVVFISLSSGLSGSYGNVKRIADEINKTSKNKIYVVDSKSATQGQRMILTLAKKLRDEGWNAKDAAEKLEEAIKYLRVNFFVSDIDYLKRGGRISALQATISKMIQLRPVVRFEADGKLNLFDKVLGSKKAIKYLFEKAKSDYDKDSGFPIYIAETCNPEAVFALKNMLQEYFGDVKIITGYIGPVIGSHTGPNALGILFFGKGFNISQYEVNK